MTEKPQFKHVPLGTNSPPLEATGEQEHMGAYSIAGKKADHVSDAEQRKDYFPGLHEAHGGEGKENSAKNMGQSLADQIDNKT